MKFRYHNSSIVTNASSLEFPLRPKNALDCLLALSQAQVCKGDSRAFFFEITESSVTFQWQIM